MSGELAAVSAIYAARIGAARAGLVPRDIAGVVRAILNERIIAVRVVLDRWSAAALVSTQKRQAARGTVPPRPACGPDLS